MRPGRKPTPTAIAEARGNPSHSRKRNYDEPEPPPGGPGAPPKSLKSLALERWHEVAPELEEMGVLAKIDSGALAAYCRVWARWSRNEDKIDDFGDVIKTREVRNRKGQVVGGGNFIQSPYVANANRALAHVRAYEAEFGMTPSSRSRVKIAKGKSKLDVQRQRFFGLGDGPRLVPFTDKKDDAGGK